MSDERPTEHQGVVYGATFVYELKPGENWCVFEGWVIIVHPDYPPQMISTHTPRRES